MEVASLTLDGEEVGVTIRNQHGDLGDSSRLWACSVGLGGVKDHAGPVEAPGGGGVALAIGDVVQGLLDGAEVRESVQTKFNSGVRGVCHQTNL